MGTESDQDGGGSVKDEAGGQHAQRETPWSVLERSLGMRLGGPRSHRRERRGWIPL